MRTKQQTNNRKCAVPMIVSIFLAAIFLITLFAPSTTHAGVEMEPVWRVLRDDPIGIKEVWKDITNIINYLVVAVLIFVAFAQILRVNINTYGVKKIIPSLVFAIVAVNFSYLFCRLLVDLANVALSLFVSPQSSGLTQRFTSITFSPEVTNSTQLSNLFDLTANIVFVFAGGVLMFVLGYLFFIRNWVIYFLVAISPLAFMSMVLPQTKSVFTQWWSNLIKWTFMPVVSVFWIWLGSAWISKVPGSSAPFMLLVFSLVCLYMALTTPFKMGGAVMQQWGNIGKKAWNKAGGGVISKLPENVWKSTGGAGVDLVKRGITGRYDRQKLKLKNRFYQGGIPGTARLANHMRTSQARQKYYTQQEQDVLAKTQGDAEKNVYFGAYQGHETGRRPLSNPQLSRVRAKLRGYIGEERETFGNVTPDQIEDMLRSRNALNAAGQLKTESELSRDLNREQYVETKAIVNRARQLMNVTIYRSETDNVMNNGYTDAAGVAHPPIIPPAHARRWRSGDIASDLYSVSAVGKERAIEQPGSPLTPQQQAQLQQEQSELERQHQQIAATIGDEARAIEIRRALLEGERPESIIIDKAHDNQATRSLLLEYQRDLVKARDDLAHGILQTETLENGPLIEEASARFQNGLQYTANALTQGNMSLPDLSAKLEQALRSIDSGAPDKIKAAVLEVSKMTGMPMVQNLNIPSQLSDAAEKIVAMIDEMRQAHTAVKSDQYADVVGGRPIERAIIESAQGEQNEFVESFKGAGGTSLAEARGEAIEQLVAAAQKKPEAQPQATQAAAEDTSGSGESTTAAAEAALARLFQSGEHGDLSNMSMGGLLNHDEIAAQIAGAIKDEMGRFAGVQTGIGNIGTLTIGELQRVMTQSYAQALQNNPQLSKSSVGDIFTDEKFRRLFFQQLAQATEQGVKKGTPVPPAAPPPQPPAA